MKTIKQQSKQIEQLQKLLGVDQAAEDAEEVRYTNLLPLTLDSGVRG